jgi:hypothetical protein
MPVRIMHQTTFKATVIALPHIYDASFGTAISVWHRGIRFCSVPHRPWLRRESRNRIPETKACEERLVDDPNFVMFPVCL